MLQPAGQFPLTACSRNAMPLPLSPRFLNSLVRGKYAFIAGNRPNRSSLASAESFRGDSGESIPDKGIDVNEYAASVRVLAIK